MPQKIYEKRKSLKNNSVTSPKEKTARKEGMDWNCDQHKFIIG
jgi:hypothetical protein